MCLLSVPFQSVVQLYVFDVTLSVSLALVCNSDIFSILTEQLVEISSSTGILLDPTYSLKAVRGMLGEMRDNPDRLKGKRTLFLHTGAKDRVAV